MFYQTKAAEHKLLLATAIRKQSEFSKLITCEFVMNLLSQELELDCQIYINKIKKKKIIGPVLLPTCSTNL